MSNEWMTIVHWVAGLPRSLTLYRLPRRTNVFRIHGKRSDKYLSFIIFEENEFNGKKSVI